MKTRSLKMKSWLLIKFIIGIAISVFGSQLNAAEGFVSRPIGSKLNQFLGTYSSTAYSIGSTNRHAQAQLRIYELNDGYSDGYFIDFAYPCQTIFSFNRYALDALTGEMTLLQKGSGNCAFADRIELKLYVFNGKDSNLDSEETFKPTLDIEIGLSSPLTPEGFLHLKAD